jgi:spore coat protein CotH
MKNALTALLLLLFAGCLTASETAVPDADSLFTPGHIIQVEVTIAPEDWHALRIGHRVTGEGFSQIVDNPYEYYPASVVIDGRKFDSVGIRKKGFFGSAVSTRPSLKIDLNRYVKDQSLAGQNMLTFNNNNQDSTRVQTYLVYRFMNEAGAKSPRSNFARIIVNGEYLGIYSHVESVRKPMMRRLFGNSKGDLWEGYAGDFTDSEYNRIVHKWGKDDESETLRALYELIQSPEPIPLESLEKLLDLDAFITFWASEVLIGHWDGYASNRNNYYLYRDPGSGLFYFIPWGPDSAFWDPGPFLSADLPKSFKADGRLCQRLWEVPEVRTRYRREMQRLLDDVWNEKRMLAEMDQALSLTQSYRQVPEQVVADNSSSIREFIESRRAEVQAELDAPALDWPQEEEKSDEGPPPVMEVSGEFNSRFEASAPLAALQPGSAGLFANIRDSLLGTGEAKIEYTLDGEVRRPFSRHGVRAVPGNPRYIRDGYPVIEFIAASDAGHPPWRITLFLDPHQVVEGKNELEVDHFTVWALIYQGEPGTEEGERIAFGISGLLELDQFSTKPGAPVSGRFHLKSRAF